VLACSDGSRELRPTSAGPSGGAAVVDAADHAADTAVPASPSDADVAWWQAVRRLDLGAARALAGEGERGVFLDALTLALHGGSAEAEAPLCALAASADDPLLRRRAGQAALNVLRIEARWEAMASFGARCGLDLKPGAIPPALLLLPAETVTLPDAPVVLPLRDTGRGLPLVDVRARGPSGEATLRALVDTGAGTCVLTSDVAARLGVTPLGEAELPVLGSTGGRLAARPASLPELRLGGPGGLVVRDVPVAIVDADAFGAVVPDVGCVVGWELLQRLVVEIGGAAGELVLRRSDGPDGAGDADAPPNLVLLYEPAVRLRSGGHDLLFLLDTGATGTDATPGLVARLGLTNLPETEDVTKGLGGSREAVVPVIPELPLELGGVRLGLAGVPVWTMPDEPQRLLELDGTLAADVALAGRLVIDGPARRVTLRAR
jgi:predicted aspartyl protease